MTSWFACYDRIGLPATAISLATGELAIEDDSSPVEGGFPPALLPLTDTAGGMMYGYWKHWFVSSRKMTIVEFYGQTRFGRPLLVMELARNFTQFVYVRLFQEFAVSDELSDESVNLALEAGISDTDHIQEIVEEYGDDEAALLNLPCFRGDPPQACFENLASYPGDFPRPGVDASPLSLSGACGYEIHSRFGNGVPDPDRLRERVAALPGAPPWLKGGKQTEVFERLLGDGDLAGAWLCLNSPGWTFDQARLAIASLSSRAKDPIFATLAEAWAALPHEKRIGDHY
jgi:hypothetical protein